MVNHQVALLASLRDGHEVLRILHRALQAVPAPMRREQPQSQDRAVAMLAPHAVPGIAVSSSAVQPRGTGGTNTSKVTITGAAAGTVLTPTVTAVANSGGHQHAGRRSVGTISPATKTADRSGTAEFTYRSNTLGGVEAISVIIGGIVVQQNIDIRVPNLLELQAGANYDLVGQTPTHPDNHFGVAGTNTSLQQIANDYEVHKQGHGLAGWPRVAYNDISLERGGIFWKKIRGQSLNCE